MSCFEKTCELVCDVTEWFSRAGKYFRAYIFLYCMIILRHNSNVASILLNYKILTIE